MYDFRIITCADGSEIIDHSLKTPYSALTPTQMTEYQEMAIQIAISERMKRKTQKEEERRLKRKRNLFYKLTSIWQNGSFHKCTYPHVHRYRT